MARIPAKGKSSVPSGRFSQTNGRSHEVEWDRQMVSQLNHNDNAGAPGQLCTASDVIGMMEKKMETTIVYLGFMGMGFHEPRSLCFVFSCCFALAMSRLIIRMMGLQHEFQSRYLKVKACQITFWHLASSRILQHCVKKYKRFLNTSCF